MGNCVFIEHGTISAVSSSYPHLRPTNMERRVRQRLCSSVLQARLYDISIASFACWQGSGIPSVPWFPLGRHEYNKSTFGVCMHFDRMEKLTCLKTWHPRNIYGHIQGARGPLSRVKIFPVTAHGYSVDIPGSCYSDRTSPFLPNW